MKQQIVIFGGLGEPKTSVVSLYQDLFSQLTDQFDLIAIDPLAARLNATQLHNRYPFSYAKHYSDLNQYERDNADVKMAACFILTPVHVHLSIIKSVAALNDVDNLLFVIEKPSFSLNDCDAGFKQTIPALKQLGARFYFIDTAIVAPSIDSYVRSFNGVLPRPNKIVAVATDNPIKLYPPLQEFEFCHRIETINRRKLLSLSNNGGGGAGLDMGVHAIAALMYLLSRSGWRIESTEIQQVIFEALTQHAIDTYNPLSTHLERELGAETHLYAQGTIRLNAPSFDAIELVIEGGKGGDIWDRRLELHYDDNIVVLGLGTLKHPPYIWQEKFVTHQTFAIKGSGYQRHFNDILSLLSMINMPQHVSCDESETIMRRSMSMLSTIYSQPNATPETREHNISKVAQHSPKFLTHSEQQLRDTLNHFLKSIVF